MPPSNVLLTTLIVCLIIMAIVIVYMFTVVSRQQRMLMRMEQALEEAEIVMTPRNMDNDILITRTPKHDMEPPRL